MAGVELAIGLLAHREHETTVAQNVGVIVERCAQRVQSVCGPGPITAGYASVLMRSFQGRRTL